MRVLVADKFEASGLDGLRTIGCDVLFEPDLADEALAGRLGSSAAEVLVVRSTRVTAAMLVPTLKLIVRAGAGVNTIDVTAAKAAGVVVANCPGRNAMAVAELAMGLILSLDRRIPDNVADLRAGTWNKKEYSKARGLAGRTLGLLGIGSIAREVIRRAAPFGLGIVVWSRRFAGEDRAFTADEARTLGLDTVARETPLALAPTPADVAARADILSVHLSLTPDTRGLVNADVLGRLKPGSFVVNTSRGEVVDHAALREAIAARGLRVGLDVFEQEPAKATGAFADAIVKLPGVYGTHHIGASTDQAQDAIARETVRIVEAFMTTGVAPSAV
ncbi:MAG TPA: NAD(P)-dependent oxidoreductase [Vicinamibacterales bacterium]|nr:NAD(P)-dependent oxidoreductase [Vicinamibacterales bacterium]